jgi:hypothetical protein
MLAIGWWTALFLTLIRGYFETGSLFRLAPLLVTGQNGELMGFPVNIRFHSLQSLHILCACRRFAASFAGTSTVSRI